MCPILKIWPNLMWRLWMVVLIVTASVVVSHAGTYVWEDFTVPFKQTIRFSTAATAIVRVTIPAGVTTASDRVPIICRIEQNSPWLRPYMIVNNNRAAFYYLGENGIVSIRSEHLKAGPNEFLFGDQTTTGDLIFIYELRFHSP